MKPTKGNIKKILQWKEDAETVYTEKEIIDIAYLLLNRRSGEAFFPHPAFRMLGIPRGNGVKIFGSCGFMIVNKKIIDFEAPD